MNVNHNISALIARTQLKKADNKLSSSLQKLSSGYKISKASDNPAGLAISNKMRTQIRALDQASSNAADGDSIIQTAEGAVSEAANILQRMRELSVQAANDTYTLDDRDAIQQEIDQLMDELDRISKDTEFNNKYLLDGSLSHTGVSTSALTDVFEISNVVENGTYGITVDEKGQKAETDLALDGPGVYYINGTSFEVKAGESDEDIYTNLLVFCDKLNLDVDESYHLSSKVSGAKQQLTISYPDGTKTESWGTDAKISLGDGFDSDKFSYSANGDYITIIDNADFRMTFDLKEDFTAGDSFDINVYGSGFLTVQIGANEGQNLEMNLPEVSCTTMGLRTADGVNIINVCSQPGAGNAIDLLDNAISYLSEARSKLGAYQNRLDSTIASLDIASENMTDAMSRITDTDMADEMTKYTQYNVISQAATSILAQANNRAETIMNILQM